MKKIFFGFLMAANLFFSQDLKVMTYNIRLSLESDKENSWNNRKDDALALMSIIIRIISGFRKQFRNR
jgi:hypothetical protein